MARLTSTILRFLLIFWGNLLVISLKCQVLPVTGAKLNYNQIMFEFEKVNNASSYQLQLCIDTAGASFDHSLLQKSGKAPATMVSNLTFGKKYKWRYGVEKTGHDFEWKGPYFFEIDQDSLLAQNLGLPTFL